MASDSSNIFNGLYRMCQKKKKGCRNLQTIKIDYTNIDNLEESDQVNNLFLHFISRKKDGKISLTLYFRCFAVFHFISPPFYLCVTFNGHSLFVVLQKRSRNIFLSPQPSLEQRPHKKSFLPSGDDRVVGPSSLCWCVFVCVVVVCVFV